LGFDVLQSELQVGSAVESVLFDAVASVELLSVCYRGPIFRQAKSNGVHIAMRCGDLHFQVAVFEDFRALIGF
jgi:hypothetical protein